MTPADPIDPDTWRRITDLFHRALEQSADRRRAFLDEACGTDTRLLEDVESLIAAHTDAGTFLEVPPPPVAELAAHATADMPVPDRIGPYSVTGVLGRGGMGVVYLALDTRLGRTVALKAVAPHVAGDDARRERLRREARAAASLSHPGIATIYALEDIDGQLYIAGEYVRGETLRDELGRGPMAVERALDTMIRVARAIATAHGRGIVHRDLKPENVMRTEAGDLKVLDFGLAQFQDPPSSTKLTVEGHLLGTPAYMAPEQVRGLPVDVRADVFSLGVMLYEFVTGANPFAADDGPSTLAKILESDPPRLASRLPLGTTPEAAAALERTVMTCLAKVPADRFESAAELAGALEQVRRLLGFAPYKNNNTTPKPVVSSSARGRWWWQFHQLTTALGYAALLLPLWQRRAAIGDPRVGTIVFLCGLIAGVVASTLRLHRWFAVELDPAAGPAPHVTTSRWLWAADLLFAGTLAIEGVFAVLVAPGWGVLLVSAAASILVSAVIIEPTTARAAFGEDTRV